MRIFIAGASGAIGLPLIAALIRDGHTVTGMTRSESGARKIVDQGAAAEQVSAFDAEGLEQALKRSQCEVVIDELTALPVDPAELAAALPGDQKLRLEGGGNLHRAARALGVRRHIQQGSGFFLKGSGRLATESDGLALDASPGVALSAQTYTKIEARSAASAPMESVVLRYGFFYGPNTWYHPNGGAAGQVRNQQHPIVGDGQGVWSFVHIEDAALATVAALNAEPGIYNIVDDDPSPVSQWLPQFARFLDAPPPPRITEQQAREAAGEDAVYYGTKLCGSSNAKARKLLNFRPRRLEWLES